MYKICVFAGTSEGRRLVSFLTTQEVHITACVATEYGESLMKNCENLTVYSARLTQSEMETLFHKEKFTCVVDATHPYAIQVTENICKACKNTGVEYLRLSRQVNDAVSDCIFVKDITQAVEILNGCEGNILLTTGSKELANYTGISDFANRVYARVLPMEESLLLCKNEGVQQSHIIAMQGPFTAEMNMALLKMTNAKFMVTKDTGAAGGFDEKLAAAKKAGVTLVVLGRPGEDKGLSFAQTVQLLCDRYGFVWKPQVVIAGIGCGSDGGITVETKAAIEKTDCIIGAERMLKAVNKTNKPQYTAIAPNDISDFIHAHKEYTSFAVVMSGDTGFFSGTKKLLPLLNDCNVRVLPGLSSLSCLCARLGKSYEDVVCLSAHGRDDDIIPQIARNNRTFVLVGGENGMQKLCRKLVSAGLGKAEVSIGQKLGYSDEKIVVGTAEQLANDNFASLSVALVEHYKVSKNSLGIADEEFIRGTAVDGNVVPMTKSEVRAVCLSKLQLDKNSVCWDIGAGTGSVAVEMALQAVCGKVYAVERKADAVKLMEINRQKFAAHNIQIVTGAAPDACVDLPAPTHIFIGGSSGNIEDIVNLAKTKNPNVRIVATAIAMETAAQLTALTKKFTYSEIVNLTVAKDRKAGEYHLMTGQNPIYIFTFQ